MDPRLKARPAIVVNCVILLYVAAGFGALRNVLAAMSRSDSTTQGLLVATVIVFWFLWMIIYQIGRGCNWARITFLLLFILGLPFSAQQLLESLPTATALLGAVQAMIQIYALFFLFREPASEWFHQPHRRSRFL